MVNIGSNTVGELSDLQAEEEDHQDLSRFNHCSRGGVIGVL